MNNAKRRDKGPKGSLPLLILLLAAGALAGSIVYGQQAVVEAQVIRIQGDGVVTVDMEALLHRGLNEIPAPAPAIPATIIVTINGSVVPPLYVNDTIIVVSESDGARAYISYVAESSVANGVVSLNVTPVGEATLIVNPSIVLLSLPAGITGVQVEDNGTIIFTFTQPSTIRFTLSQAVVPPQANETGPSVPEEDATQGQKQVGETNETRPVEQPIGEGAQEAPAGAPQTQQEANETRQEAQPEAPQDAGQGGQDGPPIGYIIMGLVALAVLVSTALYLARRKSQRRNPWAHMSHEEGPESEMVQPGLNEVDNQIIEALKNFGGELYQSDLQRLLGIPKTTLWRHIRKLADMGIVEIVKEGRANKIKLLKEHL